MAKRSWFRNLFARPAARPSRKASARRRPHLEALEDRLAPAAYHVTSLSDNGSAGTLRDAINQANANPGADTIDFQVSGIISLNGSQLPAFTDAATTAITGPSGGVTFDAQGASRVLQVSRGASAALAGLTLVNGNADGGGGILNYGTLALRDSLLAGNRAGAGGGIDNEGTLALTNCTLAGNSATSLAGGILNNGRLALTNCTLAGNSAPSSGGGGIFNGNDWNSVSLNNSIVANSQGGLDIGGHGVDGGHNLTGAVALGPLADNGGPTRTMALLDSRALNAADASLAPAADQRGFARDAAPDIGAFESVESDHHFVVTTLADEDDGTTNPSLGTGTSLREAIAFADQSFGDDTITFAVSGTIALGGSQLPAITGGLTITGPSGGVTFDAQGASRVLQVSRGASAALAGLTLVNGNADGGGGILNYGTLALRDSLLAGNRAGAGGGIDNEGTLALTNCTLAGNSATSLAGGILNNGRLALTNCTLAGNSAPSSGGGGIFNGNDWNSVSLNNSIVANSQGGLDIGGHGVDGGHNLTGAVALGPLADNSGPTRTMALLDSRALNAGDNTLALDANGNPLTTDQRGTGFARVYGGTVDIGAFEAQAPILTTNLAAVTVSEGSPSRNSGTFDSPLGRAGVTLTASPGTITQDNAAGTWSWSYTPPAGAAVPNTVTITATDASGLKATTTFTLTAVGLWQGGFEAPALSPAAYAYRPSGSGWGFAGTSGLASNGSAFNNPAAPQGSQVAFLQGTGAIIQTVNFSAGTYALSFQAAQRPRPSQSSQQTFQVKVDGAVVAVVKPSGSGVFAPYASGTFTVTAGSHRIEFVGLNPNGGDNTAFVDQISVYQPAPASLSDPGFEAAALSPAAYAYRPSGSGWGFAGTSGLASNGSGFNNPAAPQGSQVAFLQGTGSISQTVNFSAGTYILSFQAAQRPGAFQSSQQTFQVKVDGAVVATVTPSGSAFTYYATGAFTVTAGPHTIEFVGLNPNGGDNTAFLDQITLLQSPAVPS